MSERYCPQTDISEWGSAVGITRDELQSQIDKLDEEHGEVKEAHDAGDIEALILELTDCTIVTIGMLGLLGVNFNDAVQAKMAVTWEKYDPDQVEAYMALDMTRAEAFAQLKRDWQLTHGESPFDPEIAT